MGILCADTSARRKALARSEVHEIFDGSTILPRANNEYGGPKGATLDTDLRECLVLVVLKTQLEIPLHCFCCPARWDWLGWRR
jgi:hypothetical protein